MRSPGLQPVGDDRVGAVLLRALHDLRLHLAVGDDVNERLVKAIGQGFGRHQQTLLGLEP